MSDPRWVFEDPPGYDEQLRQALAAARLPDRITPSTDPEIELWFPAPRNYTVGDELLYYWTKMVAALAVPAALLIGEKQ